VSWPLYKHHGGFRYTGTITSVRYVPNDLAEDAPELLAATLRAVTLRFQ
jgi:hypothetical protein